MIGATTADTTQPVDFMALMATDIRHLYDKKQRFQYLSWAWAIIEMRKKFPDARWWPHEFEGGHFYDLAPDGSCMVAVYVQLSLGDRPHFMHLAVLDETNRAISESLIYRDGEEERVAKKPWTNQQRKASASDIANSTMRCLAKGMAAATGISLHLYAGDDVPPAPEVNQAEVDQFRAVVSQAFTDCEDVEKLKDMARELDSQAKRYTQVGWFQAQFIATRDAILAEESMDEEAKNKGDNS
jgi:hypothetical protein